MKHITAGGHPITWESLLAVIGTAVLLVLIAGGVVFWANYFWFA
jgi:hypothetical protein